ncbi:MAG: dihydroorotase [Bacteroidetes bacterium]|nr:dihydroorotase [Bacteroidota bacterium]
MKPIVIKNALIINEGISFTGDVLLKNQRIEKISTNSISLPNCEIIDANGLWLLPGVIDDQVHFREPGLTHKATIYTEAKAAVAGGVTSFMEMPNTVPNAVTQKLLEDKYNIAALTSLANYSFYMGATNDNLDEVLKTNPHSVCGVKVFMGSSTGNMLVDNVQTLENLFKNCHMLIATHCESEEIIRQNLKEYKDKYGDEILPEHHPRIRNTEACFASSKQATELAAKHNTRLHILHISTAEEISLFTNKIDLKNKKITAEVCVHHLTFDESDYKTLGNKIKCNPAIKSEHDKIKLRQALNDDYFDVIATDHAPHTIEEKNNKYLNSPSGLPLVQHSLQIMIEHINNGIFTKEKVVEKMCHAPAICFGIKERGFIREGYFADLVLVNPNKNYTISKNNILYKCAWSPFENKTFGSTVECTFVNGIKIFEDGNIINNIIGSRLEFH